MDDILLGFAGDVMIGRLVNEELFRRDSSYIWGDVLPLLHETNLNVINLEAALTRNETPVPKVFNFKSDPSHVAVLKAGNIHVVNLANNHVLDYGMEGFLDTLETLDKGSILHVGAGKNEKEAKKPLIITIQGLKICILGCTDNEPGWTAEKERAGTRYLEVGDIDSIRLDIQKLRKEVDILIVSYHWGPNMRERPSQRFQEFAHQLIDLGVDILHGHSAHVVQGVELYKKRLILYDTGDFVDDYYVDPILRNDRSFFFTVRMKKGEISSLRLVPVIISNFQVNRAKGEEADELLLRMRLLSKEFGTNLVQKNKELYLS